MKTRNLTIWILIGVSIILIGYDIYVAVNDVKEDTISEVLLYYGRQFMIIPFGLGVIMGHLFWPQRVKKENDSNGKTD